MPAYSFQKQFVPLVEIGNKLQTIRATARGAKVGSTAYLYYAQRTKQCRKLGEGIISAVVPVEIGTELSGEPYVLVGERLTYFLRELDDFAQNDGFDDMDEMIQYFCKRPEDVFKGFLIQWHSFKPANNL